MAAHQHGFEVFVQAMGGFEKVEAGVECLLDAGDAAAQVLQQLLGSGEASAREGMFSKIWGATPWSQRNGSEQGPRGVYAALARAVEALKRLG